MTIVVIKLRKIKLNEEKLVNLLTVNRFAIKNNNNFRFIEHYEIHNYTC